MRKLILWNMISLDGYFARPNGELDWFMFDDELEKYILTTQMEVGQLVFGRATYELMKGYWTTAEGTIADFMNRVKKTVFSRTLAATDWNNSRLAKGDVAGEVKRLKAEADTDIFVFGSADFSATLIRERLVDEYRFGINPVILGSGVPFFKGDQGEQKLKVMWSQVLKSGLILAHYQPA